MDASASPLSCESSTRSVQRATTVIVLSLAAVFVGCWLLYRYEASQIELRETERESLRVSLTAKLVQNELGPVAEDVRLLANGEELENYLDAGSRDALRSTIRRAKFLSERKPAYDQIRLIDQHGQEIFRVNRGGQVVEPHDLQSKATRSYFVKANALSPGTMYLSVFDLNVEDGQVERPLKPTLRLAIPVFDSSGQRRGIYIINYVGAAFFNRLQTMLPTSAGRLRLLNSAGFWLKGRSASEEWGFMWPGGEHWSLAQTDPKLWQQILESPDGQSNDSGHVFTWRRLTAAELLGVEAASLRADDRFLVVASEMAPQEWLPLLDGLRQMMLIVTLTLVLLTLFCIWLFLRWRAAMLGLRVANEQLERRVLARTAELARNNELLRAQEELLEETGSLAKVGGWDIDPGSGVGRWTDEIARIHDLDQGVVPNAQFGLQFYPAESRKVLEVALARSLADGTPYDLELEFISATGEHKWVRTISHPVVEDGKVVHMRGALQDVTTRKATEIKLKAQLQRLHLLEQITRAIGARQDLASIYQVAIGSIESELPADFVCIGLYDKSAAEVTITALAPASNALAPALGMELHSRIAIDADGLSRSVQGTLVYEPDLTPLQAAFPRRLASGGLKSVVIAPLLLEDKVFGVLITARRQVSSISSGECEFLRQLSQHVALAAHQTSLHDDLRVAYENLRSTQQIVMQRDRLRVLGQMASGIAHDINNAISPIMLYTDSLLETDQSLSERTRDILGTIQRAASDVSETVARMREFYRDREPDTELRTVRLNELVKQVIELTRARWQTMSQQQGVAIELSTEFEHPSPEASGIESEIREALTNLIFNAVDAMPRGGTLTVCTRGARSSSPMVEITDTGVGMDEDTMRRCVEPFFTTKGERGSGLGLAMVYGIMQRHGGDCRIDSVPGTGTTVRLSFAKANSPVIEPPAPMTGPTELTLLLIDDDPNVLKSLRDTLALDRHTLVTASGGEQGVELFRESLRPGSTASISAVITDLGMPRVDGRKVAAAIKEASPNTPVILLTGWGERLLTDGTIPPHVDLVLSKPPRLLILRQALASLVRAPGVQSKSLPLGPVRLQPRGDRRGG